MTDLKQLKELALKATPGPWTFEAGNHTDSIMAGSDWICQNTEYYPSAPDTTDMQFIAAANPQVILELIEKIERYEEALKFYAEGRHYSDSGEDEWIKPGKVGWDHPPCIEIHDRGDRAKEALNK